MHTPDFPVTVKKVETMSNGAFSCVVYVDNKKAFYAENDGRGGCHRIHSAETQGRALLEKVENWADAQPDCTKNGLTFKYDVDCLVDDLLDIHEHTKTARRMCKKKTTVKLDSGDIITFSTPFSERAKKEVLAYYADKSESVEYFFNELTVEEAAKRMKAIADAVVL